MKKRPIIIIAAVAALSVSVLLLSRNTVAYLMDTEAADNVIQIGQVEVSLEESNFPSSEPTVEVGRKINKDPKLKNTGTNDEYVFLKVSVPKENVTLLYESTVTDGGTTHHEGEKINNEASYTEIFKVIANGTQNSVVTENSPPTIVVGYNNGNNNTNGWIYLKKETGTNAGDPDSYYFGYNRKLKVGETTSVPLFDQVQLKSFIDGEVAGNKDNQNTVIKDKQETVQVTAYAIQADDLGITGVTGAENEYLDATALGKIWTVVNNKQG